MSGSARPRREPTTKSLRIPYDLANPGEIKSAQEQNDVVDHLAIFAERRESHHTRSQTLMHVVVKARAGQCALTVNDLQIAAPQLELICHKLQKATRRASEEWTVEQITFLSLQTPGKDDPGEIF